MAAANEMLAAAQAISAWMINLRRQIHEYPELGLECTRTGALVKATLDELNVYYYTDTTYAKTGVVGRIGSGAAPRVALRADMDALPIQELHEWDHMSKVPDVMHACGHDAHVTMLLGAAKLLQERYENKEFEGTVYLIFQPAEELGTGARLMIENGALKDAEAIFGLHVSEGAPVGWWASKAGTLMAGSANFNATINGQGGHGGRPQEAIDPIVASAYVITALQPIISRETDPADNQVITVGYINGGDANNVIPGFVNLGGTYRHVETDKNKLAERQQRILDVIAGQAEVHRCTANPCDFSATYTLPLVNGQDSFEFIKGVVMEVLQDESKMIVLTGSTAASEDFSAYLEKIPGAFAFVGCAAPYPGDGIVYGVHNPRFVLNEDCLAYGAAIHTAIAIEYIINTPTLVAPTTKTASVTSHPYRVGLFGT